MTSPRREKYNIREARKYGNGGVYLGLTGIVKLGEKFEIEELEDKIILNRIKSPVPPTPFEKAVTESEKNRYSMICNECGIVPDINVKEDIKKYGVDELVKKIGSLTHKDFGHPSCKGCLSLIDNIKHNKDKMNEPIIIEPPLSW